MTKTKIILALLGAATLAVVVWFLTQPEGSVVLMQAQRNLAETDTVHYEMELDVQGVWGRNEVQLGNGEDPIHLKGRIVSDLDRSNAELSASVSQFDLSLSSQDAGLVMKGDARRKDGRHYLRLQEASDALFPGIDRAIGKWLFSDQPFMQFLISQEEEEFEEFPLSAAAIVELEEGFSTIQVFQHVETLPNEEIDGVKNLHYRIRISEEAVAALLLKKRELATGVDAEAEEYIELIAEVKTWGEITGEAWVGKKDRRLRRLDLKTTLPDELGGAAIETRIFFSRYGEPVSVEAPEAEDVMNVFERILIGRLNLAGDREIGTVPEKEIVEESEEEDVIGDTDGDGLSDASESFYGSDAWNPDSDADGWPDGVEVANGRDPMGPGVLFGFGL